MIQTALDKNNKLFKISENIHFRELNAFANFTFQADEDMYVSLIATGKICFCSINASNAYKVEDPRSLLMHVPKNHTFEVNSSELDSKCLIIVFNKRYVDSIGMEDQKILNLIKEYYPNTIEVAAIYPLIIELLHSNTPKYLRRIQQKSKVLDIFFKQLAYISNAQQANVLCVKGEELKKAEKARELIDANVSNTYTISELSRITGTNEQYLKKHFKQLYHMTIHTYMLKNKMNHAKELLIEGDHKIAVIANKIGYKHATHFTTAFKKHFGFLPNSIRFNWLAYFSPYYLELFCII